MKCSAMPKRRRRTGNGRRPPGISYFVDYLPFSARNGTFPKLGAPRKNLNFSSFHKFHHFYDILKSWWEMIKYLILVAVYFSRVGRIFKICFNDARANRILSTGSLVSAWRCFKGDEKRYFICCNDKKLLQPSRLPDLNLLDLS